MGVCGEVGVCGSAGVPSKLELSGRHLGAEWNRQVSGASISTAGKGVGVGEWYRFETVSQWSLQRR